MEYLISFLEGVVTFLSPCLLPMLPIYIGYFAGGGQRSTGQTLTCAAGFVLGFTTVFVAMGALAGSLGSFLTKYQTAVNIVCGLVVILFGLSYLGLLPNVFRGGVSGRAMGELHFGSAWIFGLVFSLGWTPCVGTFLGSALMLAGQQGSVWIGILMLLAYSAGLGLPFLLSAVLIDQLKETFAWIKARYDIINKICGWMLVAVGTLMSTGLLNRFFNLLR